MINKQRLNSVVAGVLAATAMQVFAQADQVSGPQTTDASVATVLEDKVHLLSNTLGSKSEVHHYSFTAVRGQDVVLLISEAQTYGKLWQLEYRIDAGEWKVKRWNWTEKFQKLSPGAKVEVRVMAVEGAQFDEVGYRIGLGSFPHMRYDFHHQEGFLPIPIGRTEPRFLATQAMTEAMLDVSFTDSTGHPLAGGVVAFDFRPSGKKENRKTTNYTSDRNGKILELVKFEGCTGGYYADPFLHVNNGRNTWATRYEVGDYKALNLLAGTQAEEPHLYNFGHICKRWLINWSRN